MLRVLIRCTHCEPNSVKSGHAEVSYFPINSQRARRNSRDPRIPLPCASSGLESACMRKKSRKPPSRRIVLQLPDLDHTKSAVLNSPSSPHSRRNCSEPRLARRRSQISTLSRIARISCRNNQSAACGSEAAGVSRWENPFPRTRRALQAHNGEYPTGTRLSKRRRSAAPWPKARVVNLS